MSVQNTSLFIDIHLFGGRGHSFFLPFRNQTFFWPSCLECISTLFDFEEGNNSLATWNKTGDAFSFQPTYGDNPTARNREPSNHQGNYWIGGYENRPTPESKAGTVRGDRLIGTITSPVFRINGVLLSFLIGGGCDERTLRVELIVDNVAVRFATGKCFETMKTQSWNTTEFVGKIAHLRLVDYSTGGWGHINFDNLREHLDPCEGIVGKVLTQQFSKVFLQR